FERQAWADAYAQLSAAAREAGADSLAPEDLVLLATAANLTGRETEGDALQARAYQAFIDRGELTRAARCAFWLGSRLHSLGDPIRGQGWYARAQRLINDVQRDCVEQGYLHVARGRQTAGEGDTDRARTEFDRARQIGERFADIDLVALARLG